MVAPYQAYHTIVQAPVSGVCEWKTLLSSLMEWKMLLLSLMLDEGGEGMHELYTRHFIYGVKVFLWPLACTSLLLTFVSNTSFA